MLEKDMEHMKLAGILAQIQPKQISCPCNAGGHSIRDLRYCGRIFNNRGELYKHLLEQHTNEELEKVMKKK